MGEDVLVESRYSGLLWDASVSGISKKLLGPSKSLVIDAYRVNYAGWTTHFTEWVEPHRVVEPNENNRLLQVRKAVVFPEVPVVVDARHPRIRRATDLLQDELQEERAGSRWGLPTALALLTAKDYLQARDRVRGTAPLPDFAKIAQAPPNSSSSQTTFVMMKAAILAIEAALPLGSVNTTEHGLWSDRNAQQWRYLVEHAEGPARLMQCLILLEDVIDEEWIREDVGHLRSCLPARWIAVGECTPSSLAVRVILLDRSINYGTVDRKRFRSRKKSSN